MLFAAADHMISNIVSLSIYISCFRLCLLFIHISTINRIIYKSNTNSPKILLFLLRIEMRFDLAYYYEGYYLER